MVKALLTLHTIDTNRRTNTGTTSLMLAAQNNNKTIIVHLLEAGADRAIIDNNGKNYLDYLEEHTKTIVGFQEIERKK
ncbi:hypothetical protein Noda2021_05050 [Candidatus Dependentiae bacterium Noda2021]|nr:hypothetical protein Noda2021_05050 [Candidatus Dependentiae bacterium Noda2021]